MNGFYLSEASISSSETMNEGEDSPLLEVSVYVCVCAHMPEKDSEGPSLSFSHLISTRQSLSLNGKLPVFLSDWLTREP